MLRKILFIILFSHSFCFCALPELKPKDVTSRINEILKHHVSYKKLDSEIIERTSRNFIEKLDPMKTYFLESDISKWLYPSEELKQMFLNGFKTSDFSGFEEIHRAMIKAIERRNSLESEIETALLPQDIDSKELKDAPWVNSKEELVNRLLKIKALQLEAAKKLDDETKEQFVKRIQKNRLNNESKILKNTKKLILSNILEAFAESLDSHTKFLPPDKAKQFLIQIQQRLFGIGVMLQDNLNGFRITRIIEKGPAAKSKKLKIKDRIIAVDKKPIVGMDIRDAVGLIRGEKGSKAFLTVLRENATGEDQKLEVEITRDEVIIEDMRLESSTFPYADGIIGHLHLFSFYQDQKYSSAQDIKNAVEKMKKENNLKGLILDLRNNSGGPLNQAVAVTSLFITKGIVVSTKDENNNITHLRDTEGKTIFDGPLIVLTNRASASSSEIVAQTLQDYKRAIIVGDEKTFGKGSFQTFTLNANNNSKVNPKGEYKVTKGKYYGVSGKSPQLLGVKPDIIVPGILSNLEIGEEFTKFPLKNDKIKPNFQDDLSDVPNFYKKKISLLYKHNLQQVLMKYFKYLDILSKNSQKRILENKNYQKFLKKIKKENFDDISVEIFSKTDSQFKETLNIMKDLIFLENFDQKQASSY
jgi:carboxyl-terminal processing protease